MEEIVIPTVVLVHGYRIDCADGRCGTIGFETDETKAQQQVDRHKGVHRAHEEQVRAYAAEIQAANGDADKPLPDIHLTCPRCMAAIGAAHDARCDVARCLDNGGQRALREHVFFNGGKAEDHTCGHDVWTGYYPGEKEAAEYGVPVMVLKELGSWDKATLRWVLPEGWEQTMHERGLGPKMSGA